MSLNFCNHIGLYSFERKENSFFNSLLPIFPASSETPQKSYPRSNALSGESLEISSASFSISGSSSSREPSNIPFCNASKIVIIECSVRVVRNGSVFVAERGLPCLYNSASEEIMCLYSVGQTIDNRGYFVR